MRVEIRVEIAASSRATRVDAVPENPSVVLKESGYLATIEPDRFVPGSYQLVVDGTPQSHVNLDDPSQLFFEYVQRMGNVIDLIGDPGQPITAVHLGAGALTLPRYIAYTRPGSRQQVVELESNLVDLVRENLPLPRYAQVRIRHGDAREVVGKLPAGLRGSVDLLVIDIFSGARTPAHVTSVEFYRSAVSLLAPDGIVLVNVADGPPLTFARSQIATLGSVVQNVAALAETQVLKGRRFGNVVLVGSNASLPLDWLPRLLASGPHPAKAVAGAELKTFAGKAPIVTDATSVPSPPPARSIFQTGTRRD
jgi:spermidine synthase